MPRKPEQTVQVNLRAPESLRRKLEIEATRHGCSLNREMVSRLRASFDKDALRVLDEVAKDLEVSWSRYSERFLRLRLNHDLMAAIDDLLTNVDKLATAQGLDALALAIDEVKRTAEAVRTNREFDEAVRLTEERKRNQETDPEADRNRAAIDRFFGTIRDKPEGRADE
jgi:plasmid stability protein